MDLLDYLWPIYDLIMGKIPSNEDVAMDELCQRFPLIAQKIMKHVDNKTLINFKEAGRTTNEFFKKREILARAFSCLAAFLQTALT